MHIFPDTMELIDQLHNKLGLDNYTIEIIYQLIDQCQWSAFQMGFIEGMSHTSYDKDGERVIGLNEKPLEWWVAMSQNKIDSYKKLFTSTEEEDQSEV